MINLIHKYKNKNWSIHGVWMYIAATFLAVGLFCGIGAIFLTSPTLYEYNKTLEFAPMAEGSWKHQRSEGWVDSRFGKLGLEQQDSLKLQGNKPKILIYGDSYIEAHMVPGPHRIQNQINSAKYEALAIGFSGIGGKEYAYLMSRYPKIIGNVFANVILIGDIYDFEADNLNSWDGYQRGMLPLKSSGRIDIISQKFYLFGIRALWRKWRNVRFDFLGNSRLRQRTVSSVADHSNFVAIGPAIGKLREASGAIPLLIVYAPTIPRIEDNRVVFFDKNIEIARELEIACRGKGIGFINLGDNFCDYFRKTGKFPRGFFNTPLGVGHLNSAGHQIAGEAVGLYFNGRR